MKLFLSFIFLCAIANSAFAQPVDSTKKVVSGGFTIPAISWDHPIYPGNW